MMEAYLLKLGSEDRNEEATQAALSSLVRVVKQMNRSLSRAAEEGTIGADALMSLSRRTNEYFTRFVGAWLKSDSIASHFVFELGGFEFLLDTIGKTDPESAQSGPTWSSKVPKVEQQPALTASTPITEDEEVVDSDIYEMLHTGDEASSQE